jgi:hypothetical protein
MSPPGVGFQNTSSLYPRPPPRLKQVPHLTTQMLWRSLKLQLLTPRSGIGVEGPPTRLGAGLAQADVGRGRPAPLAALTAPALLLLLLAPAANDLRRGLLAAMWRAALGVLLPLLGEEGARDWRLLLDARAALAARAAAASSTAAARPSRTSNS